MTVVTPQLRTDATSRIHDDGRITIDDGSTPPLAGATHRLPVRRGPAAARNAARPFVDTELVAFLDADVEAPDGWLEPLLAHFDDPKVGLVAPRVTGETGSPLDLGDEPARIRSGTRVSYVPGAALVVRVAAFDAVGGFDPTLRFGEDVDFVWRLDEAGWRCRYEPAGAVWHEPRATLAERLRQHAGYGTSAAPLALRHPGALSPVRFNGWTAFVWAAIVGGHPVIGGAAAVGSSLALGRKLPDLPTRGVVRARHARAPAGRTTDRRCGASDLVADRVARLARLATDAVDRTRIGRGRRASNTDRCRLRMGRVAWHGAPPHVRPDRPSPQRMAGAPASVAVTGAPAAPPLTPSTS